MSDLPVQPNPLAIASLVAGVVSLPCICLCYGFPFNVLAIVLGGVAVAQAGNDPAQAGGKNFAWGGIGLGALSLVLGVGYFVLALSTGVLSTIIQEM